MSSAIPWVVATSLVVFLLPLPLLGLTAWRPMTRLGVVSALLFAASYHVFSHYVGLGWIMFGLHTRWLLGALFPLTLLRVWQLGTQARWFPCSWWSRSFVLAGFAGALILLYGIVEVLRARAPSADAVNVRWPLEDGAFAVAHGGTAELLNHHHPVSAQRFAWDVIRVGRLGERARGFFPSSLRDYYIFGTPVLAPCTGQIVALATDRPDLPPGQFDEDFPLGNFVALYCATPQAITVVLAHLERGSVQPALNDQVPAGAFIGRVGNSGNTSEPHLHIHAVQGRVADLEQLLFSGHGVLLRVEDIFPVRNDYLVFP
ncbi:MAG: hypothetical protein RJA70_768 [Pseudomonadota bacterium]|jgi:hypothetical protein